MIKQNFEKIYNSNTTILKNENKAIRVPTNDNLYIIEFITYKDNKLFLKIGQETPNNTVTIRDKETLESKDVPMTSNQLLELYTYCFIDFNNLIISYIGINGAPKISAINKLFDQNLKEEHVYTKISVIISDDILNSITKKHIISKIEVSVATPSDEVLSDRIGLSAKEFDYFDNIKTSDFTFKLVAKRNNNIFKSKLNRYNYSFKIKIWR